MTLLAGDAQAIRALQIAYGQTFDVRDADGYAAVFSEDAEIVQHNGHVFPGAKARKAVANMPAATGGYHRMLHTSLDIAGDEAAGRCDFVSRSGDGHFAAGHYDDRYRRTQEGWKISARKVNIDRWIDEAEATALQNGFDEKDAIALD